MKIENLTSREAVIVKNLDSQEVIFEHNTEKLFDAASLVKVFYAAVIAKEMVAGHISDEVIAISSGSVNIPGTNVLKDVLPQGGVINLPASILVGLMLKYSCNASTQLLFDQYFRSSHILEDYIDKYQLTGVKLYDDSGKWINYWSLRDITEVFADLYIIPENYGQLGIQIRQHLSESRGIYYLFDQLGIEVLGSKTGTNSGENCAQINNIGVVVKNGIQYAWGAMVSENHISDGVLEIRRLGRIINNQIE